MIDKIAIPLETRQALIGNQIQMWRNTQFDLIIQKRVLEKLGEKEKFPDIEKAMIRAEKALEALESMLKELE